MPKAEEKALAMALGNAIYEETRDHWDVQVEDGWWHCSCGAPIAEDDGGYEPEDALDEHQMLAVGFRVLRALERLRNA